MRDIQTPTQFDKYKDYEKTMVKLAETGVRMMASMLQQKPGTKTLAGK